MHKLNKNLKNKLNLLSGRNWILETFGLIKSLNEGYAIVLQKASSSFIISLYELLPLSRSRPTAFVDGEKILVSLSHCCWFFVTFK